MQRRRTALAHLALVVLATCCGPISCASFRTKTGRSNELSRLKDDLKILDRSPDSTDGVPVFLVCENLPTQVQASASNLEGKNLAANFWDIADLFPEVKPTAAASDIPKLAELLALRDFGVSKEP